MMQGSSSSECSYDSEEDRVQERLRSMAQRRQVEAQAAFESDVLRKWRERRRHTQGRGHHVFTGAGADSIRENSTTVAANVDTLIDDHRRQWRDFEDVQTALRGSVASHELLYDDVPWIPDGVSSRDYLVHVARAEHGGRRQEGVRRDVPDLAPGQVSKQVHGLLQGRRGMEAGGGARERDVRRLQGRLLSQRQCHPSLKADFSSFRP